MNAGKLRHMISIVRATATADGMGGATISRTTLFTTRAAIFPTAGREIFRGIQMQSEQTHLIECRYRHGVEPRDLVEFGAREFEIEEAVNFEERGIQLRLKCREVKPKERP